MAKGTKGFEKGKSGNPNGRGKGVPNKRTAQWETFAEYCLTGGLEKFEEEMKKLNGKDYIQAFTNIMEFHKPKLSRAEIKAEIEETGIKTYKIVNASSGDNQDK